MRFTPAAVIMLEPAMSHFRLLIGLVAFSFLAMSDTTAAGVPGDYNDNGTVDAADFAIYRANLGTVNLIPNDITPHWVMEDDFDIWKINFGKAAAGGGAGAATTPEPSGLSATILLGLLLYMWGPIRSRSAERSRY
jgi:hypothetical protein